MALYGETVTKREGYWILTLKGQNLVFAQLTDCTSYSPIRFHLHTLIAVNRS